MRAMILAAGLGTRLRPLTNDRPKALVEINDRTLLEITLARLRRFGVHEVIINVHHFADAIVDYLAANKSFDMEIAISREDELLDTGGGLKKAAHFFIEHSADEPFLLHNVDVLSSIDLQRMIDLHRETDALATLAVKPRDTSRRLIFDSRLQLCGRIAGDDKPELVRAISNGLPLAFCGVHVISPRIFPLMKEEGAFSIIDSYLQLTEQGDKILGFRADEYYWRDVGTPESVVQADRDVREGLVPL